jgi:hypothetical protein
VLKHRGPDAIGRMVDHLSEAETVREDVRGHLGSLRKRLALISTQPFEAPADPGFWDGRACQRVRG